MDENYDRDTICQYAGKPDINGTRICKNTNLKVLGTYCPGILACDHGKEKAV